VLKRTLKEYPKLNITLSALLQKSKGTPREFTRLEGFCFILFILVIAPHMTQPDHPHHFMYQ